MFGARWQIFRLMGIPIYLSPSWLIILALLTMTLAGVLPTFVGQYYPGVEANIAPWMYWVAALGTALAFFGCIVLHELGHAIAARTQNLKTRGITLFLFGGVAELGDEPKSPGAEFIMAIAGPVVTVILAIGLGVLTTIGYYGGWPPLLVITFGYLTAINVFVLIFNMIPAFPLDGGRVLRSFLWSTSGSLRRATWWAAGAGRVFGWVLVGVGVLSLLERNFIGGIWFGLIGFFLTQAANSSYLNVLVRQTLQGETVRRFMNPDPITVPSTLSIREWVDDYVYRYHRKSFPVIEGGQLVGYLDTRDLARVPRGEWEFRNVDELMHRDIRAVSTSPDSDALDALKQMQNTGASRLLVTDNGDLQGVLSLKDLLRFLSLKLELEGEGAEPAAWNAVDVNDRYGRADDRMAAGRERRHGM